jgi:LacI family transcriptional regulator
MKKESKQRTALATPSKGHSPGSVKLKELAAHLGLSQSTVSRVMNDAGDEYRIAPETQKRILQAAALFNYEPNAVARQLRNKRSFTVGVIVPEISEGYASAVLGGIEDALLQEKYFYFVVSHRHRPDLLKGYPRLLLSRAVEGIIAVDTPMEEDLPVPVVAVSSHQHRKGIVTIELDHLTAVRYALNHLSAMGHRRIAFIKGQNFSSDTAARWNAIRKVCAELDIAIDPQLVVQLEGVQPGPEPGHEATRALLARGKPFTAIFAFNDVSAMGAIAALHEAGLHVPRDVSVVGFDDIPAAATIRPSLTTVRQPLYDMGSTAAVNLLRLIREGKPVSSPQTILVTPTFLQRHSTARRLEKPARAAK